MATRQIPQLTVQARVALGSRHAGRLREAGNLPAVIYGHGKEPVHVFTDLKAITEILHHNAHVVEVTLDATKEPCLIKDIQWNHLGSQIIHVDLARVDLTEKVTIKVELKLIGDAIGLKSGGAFLEQRLPQLEVRCLALDIPEDIKVDVSALNINDTLTVAQLKLPEGVETDEDPETVVAGVFEALEEEAAPVVVAEGAAAEPEVIGRKAKEEGEEGAAAPEGKKEK